MQNGDQTSIRRSRNVLASLCIVLPVIFYFGVFGPSVQQISDGRSLPSFRFSEKGFCVTGTESTRNSDGGSATGAADHAPGGASPGAVDPAFEFRNADLAGQLDFVLPSVLLRSVALISIVISFYIIRRSMGLKLARLIIAIALILVAGLIVGSKMVSAPGSRTLLIDPILSAEPAQLINDLRDKISDPFSHHL